MARQKKVYCSTNYLNSDPKANTHHQSRGGGMTTRKNSVHRYPTQAVETPISPTFIAATKAKKLKV